MRVRLGDVCVKDSSGIAQKDLNGHSGEYPIYGASGYITSVDFYQQEQPYIAVVKDGAGVGRIMSLPAKSSVIGTMQYILPKDDIDISYLAYAMEYMNLAKYYTGATIPHIYFKDYQNEMLPLPPLEEQRHIAAVLDKVSELISKRKAQLDKLDELVKSRFVEMFGDPVSNPKQWSTLSLRDAGSRLSDGPFGSNLKSEHYTTEGVRVIRLGNIGVGKFIDNDKSYISKQHYEKLKKYTCKAGEIVIATLGEPNLRACLVPQRIECAVNKADCVHYIPKKELLNTRFVCQYINCPETLLLASEMVHGQTRSRISSGQLAEMKIFVPPKELQEQFAAFVEKTEKTKATISHSLDQHETLKKALMQKYFG